MKQAPLEYARGERDPAQGEPVEPLWPELTWTNASSPSSPQNCRANRPQPRPAGRGAPRIDPKPILDGWKLLEATAIYRASGKNVLYGDADADGFSIGMQTPLREFMLGPLPEVMVPTTFVAMNALPRRRAGLSAWIRQGREVCALSFLVDLGTAAVQPGSTQRPGPRAQLCRATRYAPGAPSRVASRARRPSSGACRWPGRSPRSRARRTPTSWTPQRTRRR